MRPEKLLAEQNFVEDEPDDVNVGFHSRRAAAGRLIEVVEACIFAIHGASVLRLIGRYDFDINNVLSPPDRLRRQNVPNRRILAHRTEFLSHAYEYRKDIQQRSGLIPDEVGQRPARRCSGARVLG